MWDYTQVHLYVLKADVGNVAVLEVHVGLAVLEDVPGTDLYNAVGVVGLGDAEL